MSSHNYDLSLFTAKTEQLNLSGGKRIVCKRTRGGGGVGEKNGPYWLGSNKSHSRRNGIHFASWFVCRRCCEHWAKPIQKLILPTPLEKLQSRNHITWLKPSTMFSHHTKWCWNHQKKKPEQIKRHEKLKNARPSAGGKQHKNGAPSIGEIFAKKSATITFLFIFIVKVFMPSSRSLLSFSFGRHFSGLK